MKLRDLFPMDQDYSPAVNICGSLVVLLLYYLLVAAMADASITFSAWILGR
jgi:hypothetical protein